MILWTSSDHDFQVTNTRDIRCILLIVCTHLSSTVLVASILVRHRLFLDSNRLILLVMHPCTTALAAHSSILPVFTPLDDALESNLLLPNMTRMKHYFFE